MRSLLLARRADVGTPGSFKDEMALEALGLARVKKGISIRKVLSRLFRGLTTYFLHYFRWGLNHRLFEALLFHKGRGVVSQVLHKAYTAVHPMLQYDPTEAPDIKPSALTVNP